MMVLKVSGIDHYIGNLPFRFPRIVRCPSELILYWGILKPHGLEANREVAIKAVSYLPKIILPLLRDRPLPKSTRTLGNPEAPQDRG